MRSDSSYLDSIDSGHDLRILARPSVGGNVENSPGDLVGRTQIANNFESDSSHQIARHIAMGAALVRLLAPVRREDAYGDPADRMQVRVTLAAERP